MGRAFQNRKESMARTSLNKARVYSRYGREIYVSAKSGGVDPNGNLSLRRLIEKAKKDQVPTHVIDKAIDKAKGAGGEDFALARYEGFGPGNVMVIVDCLTDNNNRTFGEVRTCFNKGKGKLGAQGSVSHMFDHRAILSFKGAEDDEEKVLEALMEADVDVSDIELDDGIITVLTPTTEHFKAKGALTDLFGEDLDFEVDEISFIPQIHTEVSGDDAELLNKMLEMLDDCEDVQQVHHNGEFV
ncbi:YebC/PmpR family DNA-binding transcriptional regulator [Cobetia marina]|jgi:YebC/PmpR family DNA-binding regulatory protein|uniref:Probable transcriptional regulatory protein V6243_06705 n=1 Tax=Cobetia marina TaxID=28258 RepID=A0ABU9GDH6_COBMA|nr:MULTISPECIES: YebC/PmpR family DNA-binding transcriptional regulator [Cobetia]AOM01759.1 transcriptional regulator [Cobetia marina]AZV31616.1 YebC/PmpR family DNA-binding regulatory protein [Cobetia sp. ICG0124]MDA5562308.1 YebC/PmpR family DNA-binding transcriptional regulator [Cobetia sp. MMG027]MDH2292975.1 YebC/PmpR family DNA-binding transcriptional regulator [Cobetia sp. 10Alg 146]MDH2375045.1 YebC/PmpR family DNA-binding transcriptional regulator [Cobetia sp. 3AK]